jgi:hypothetical protein
MILQRRLAWRVIMAEKIAVMFSQDPEVAAKCTVTCGLFASRAWPGPSGAGAGRS